MNFSIAKIKAMISALKANPMGRDQEEALCKNPWEVLKMSPHPLLPREPKADPFTTRSLFLLNSEY